MGLEGHIVTIVVICLMVLHSVQMILKAVDDVAKVTIQTLPVLKELIDLMKSLW